MVVRFLAFLVALSLLSGMAWAQINGSGIQVQPTGWSSANDLADLIGASQTTVPNEAALVALAVPSNGVQVYRKGTTTAGDGGGALYTYSTSACTLNSGAGDGSSQVKPTIGGGCWNAVLGNGTFTVNTARNANTPCEFSGTGLIGGAYQYLPQEAQVVACNNWGEGSLLGMARTQDNASFSPTQTCCSQGAIGAVLNDNVTHLQSGWAGYLTATRGVGAGTTFGAEVEVANLGANQSFGPYDGPGQTTGATVDLWLGCGGEAGGIGLTINPCSNALTILNSQSLPNSKFNVGMVFENNSLITSGGIANAILFPQNYQLGWLVSAGNLGATINSEVSGGNGTSILFANSGMLVTTVSGAPLFQVPYIANTVNYLQAVGSATGSPVVLNAAGTDTNIAISMGGKGTGSLNLQSPVVVLSMPTSCTGQVTGTLWNSSGTVHVC
jgi:hypothetical protein